VEYGQALNLETLEAVKPIIQSLVDGWSDENPKQSMFVKFNAPNGDLIGFMQPVNITGTVGLDSGYVYDLQCLRLYIIDWSSGLIMTAADLNDTEGFLTVFDPYVFDIDRAENLIQAFVRSADANELFLWRQIIRDEQLVQDVVAAVDWLERDLEISIMDGYTYETGIERDIIAFHPEVGISIGQDDIKTPLYRINHLTNVVEAAVRIFENDPERPTTTDLNYFTPYLMPFDEHREDAERLLRDFLDYIEDLKRSRFQL
jgi:hypothetical protein